MVAGGQGEEKRPGQKLPEDMVLGGGVVEHSCDLLAYWNLKRSSWSRLSTLAVGLGGSPPSTVPSEKLFSMPMENGNIGQPQVKIEHFEKFNFLKVNLPLMYFQY